MTVADFISSTNRYSIIRFKLSDGSVIEVDERDYGLLGKYNYMHEDFMCLMRLATVLNVDIVYNARFMVVSIILDDIQPTLQTMIFKYLKLVEE